MRELNNEEISAITGAAGGYYYIGAGNGYMGGYYPPSYYPPSYYPTRPVKPTPQPDGNINNNCNINININLNFSWNLFYDGKDGYR